MISPALRNKPDSWQKFRELPIKVMCFWICNGYVVCIVIEQMTIYGRPLAYVVLAIKKTLV